jgi:hypothetical protein
MATCPAEAMARGALPAVGACVRFGWKTSAAITFPAGGT